MKAFTIFIGLGIVGILEYLLVYWTSLNLDYWCTYFAHHSVHISKWLVLLLCLLTANFVLFLDIISEIIKAVMN